MGRGGGRGGGGAFGKSAILRAQGLFCLHDSTVVFNLQFPAVQ